MTHARHPSVTATVLQRRLRSRACGGGPRRPDAGERIGTRIEANARHLFLVPGLAFLLAFVPALAPAQIGIGGIADKTIYTSQATFTVTEEAGYAYDARLDGMLVPVGAPVAVTNVDYHELSVWRTNTTTLAAESRLVRFIVRSAERGSAEDGIPAWTPYPLIDSAPEEFAGGSLRIVAPMDYPEGMEIPWSRGWRIRRAGPSASTGA